MSFVIPGVSACVICDCVIAGGVDVARLQYASEDDVGALARHGRAWVHRACWQMWPQRDAWASSSVRLMAAAPGAVCVRGVVALPMGADWLVVDAAAAIDVAIRGDGELAEIPAAVNDPDAWHDVLRTIAR